ncbi:N-acetylglutamate synthase-like GNAT family acetyltransferase [Chitinophaga niastensis]|uniref:N-acetylglutamate synthase-like GNAT family acetyltransferase n=1 Tax=Chitinophaga niastensis TaxID=536980 RepID=A0A2P8HTN3_CHINA|nr:GNAT family N-acetyltransferase [Chitinophaga niastensis]PSL49562.1 N-acetylglutamate synthase-like GNAT family acetyltransferase [Chitinophaga niastensis]
MITYRKAAIADVLQLSDLRLRFLKEIYPNADISGDAVLLDNLKVYLEEHLLKDDFVNWFAEMDGKVVASAGIVFYNQPPLYHNLEGKVAYILNVYTLPHYRRKGIAKVLFEKIMNEARQRNTGKVSLHASKDGRKLYEQFGFVTGDNEMTCQLPRIQ